MKLSVLHNVFVFVFVFVFSFSFSFFRFRLGCVPPTQSPSMVVLAFPTSVGGTLEFRAQRQGPRLVCSRNLRFFFVMVSCRDPSAPLLPCLCEVEKQFFKPMFEDYHSCCAAAYVVVVVSNTNFTSVTSLHFLI